MTYGYPLGLAGASALADTGAAANDFYPGVKKGGQMSRINRALLFFLAVLALPVLAAEPLKRQPQAIPVYSVSPGSAGSISNSAHSQRYEVQPIPGLPNGVSTRSTTVYGRAGVQQSGGIRQSIEYPNGMRVPQPSVQGSYQRQRGE
jgi:hypothetical protein